MSSTCPRRAASATWNATTARLLSSSSRCGLAPLSPPRDPSYAVIHGIADSTPYEIPGAGALLHTRRLAPNERTALPDSPFAYLHLVRGHIRLGEERLAAGDSARITTEPGLEAVATGDASVELLVWEMTGG